FALRPDADTVAGRGDARALLLEDMAAVAHLLADSTLDTGAAFAIANPDPGFSVQTFVLDAGTIHPGLDAGQYVGRLDYRGRAETGLRILAIAGPRLAIPYVAPAGNPGPAGRTEYVAVHLATPARGRGLFLGSAAIQLLGS